ncbi:MAG TPA: porin family protein [Flavisolibacter sp.]|nr:porin family protein [Flavisolibacter sp.]
MKKHLFLLSALALSVAAMAQSNVSFGVRAGITNANLRGNAVESFQNLIDFAGGAVSTNGKTGFYGGGFVSIPVSEQFSIEPGITYSQKGYELKGSFGIKGTDLAAAKAQLNLNYIDLPVLAKANINGLQLFAGPQVSYLANADLHTTAGALGFNFINNHQDVKDQFNPWDVALTGGVGYQFGNGFSLNAAYDYGLSKINSGQSIDAHNQAVKVGVGFRF